MQKIRQSDTALCLPAVSRCKTRLERVREPTVSDAHSADELAQALCVEQVADHAVALALVEATFRSARDDTACILPAVGVSRWG